MPVILKGAEPVFLIEGTLRTRHYQVIVDESEKAVQAEPPFHVDFPVDILSQLLNENLPDTYYVNILYAE